MAQPYRSLWLFVASLSVVLTPNNALACFMGEQGWQRHGAPVYRDAIPEENYEAASDPHVVVDQAGQQWMIYSGDDQGHISIKLARGTGWDRWKQAGVLLGSSTGHPVPLEKETPFYYQTPTGEHELYFIGYSDGDIYDSDLYMARSNTLTGPYRIDPTPIVSRGQLAGRAVEVITSPSVVAHQGVLYMVFLAWDGFEDVTTVWVMGAISRDQGRSWGEIQEVAVPVGMEGQLTRLPTGQFVAVRTGEVDGVEGIMMACAAHPFGPYTARENPVLMSAGSPWEVDEIIAPQITVDPGTGQPILYYTGAEHRRGWWIMKAVPGP